MNIILLQKEELRSGFFSLQKTDDRFRHIKKILKLSVGSVFKAGIINGEKGRAEITAFSDELLTAHFTVSGQASPLPRIKLILGFPRPIQLRRILRDVAGLGIETLYLTGTELGEKSYLQADIAAEAEIERLLIDGCSQAGETTVPQVYRAYSLRQFFDRYGAEISFESKRAVLDVPSAVQDTVQHTASALIGSVGTTEWNVHNSQAANCGTAPFISPLTALQWNGTNPLWLAAGSERGWSTSERHLFTERHFTAYSMGERILRTETAVTAAVSVCLALSGIWNVNGEK